MLRSEDDSAFDTTFCFTPDTSGVYCFEFELDDDDNLRGIVEDDDDEDSVCITIIIDSPPVASCPSDTALFVCDLSSICLPGFSATDFDGNLMSLTVNGGAVSGGSACFTPVAGANILTLIATDSCGRADTCVTTVTVTVNAAPVAASPADMALFVCDLSAICLPGFGAVDSDGNLATMSVVGGTLSGDTVCFTPVVGANVITLIATDSCGLADTSVTTITVSTNTGPVVACPTDLSLFVCDLSDICLPGFSATDSDGNLMSAVVDNGSLSGDTVCFTPVVGANTITLIATDSCGVADTCVTTVTIALNTAPVATSPANSALFVCDLSQICLTGFTGIDSDGNLATMAASGGTLSGGTVCFTPVAGVNTLTFIATDSCGLADTSVTTVTVTVNAAPVVACPTDLTLFVCDLSDICLPGFSATDSDGNLMSASVDNGSLSGDTVCFTPVAGVNTITLIATDSCGVADTCVTTVTVTLNSAPVTSSPADDTLFVCDMSAICLPGFGASDADGNLSALSVTGGSLSGNTVCFTPVMGANIITLIATDSCGLADTSVTTVIVAINNGPVVACPTDLSLFVCDLSDICLPGFGATDSDGNLMSAIVDNGSLSGDTVCFTPVVGANTITMIATDSCGVADTCVTTVTIALNAAPVATSPANSALFVCDLSQICLPGFTATDSDGNLATMAVIGGTLSNDTVCFTPVAGANTLTFIATDSCGLADTSITTITVTVNAAPVVACPTDLALFVCDLSDICLPGFNATDADGNLLSVSVDNGALSGDTVCFTPVAGANVITLIATDSCGIADTCVTTVTVTLNSAPVTSAPADDTLFVCDMSDICLTGFGASDADGNLSALSVTGGSLSGDTVCFTPAMGANVITFIATDSCGLADTSVTTVIVAINNGPVVACPTDLSLFVCDLSDICLPGFSATDSDGNLMSAIVDNGSLSGDTVCFTPVAGANTITMIATDSCGVADTCVTIVTIALNAAPVATSPANSALFVCDLSEICLTGFTATDSDGNLATMAVIGGILSNDTVCFTPVAGANTITLVSTDSCGLADTTVTIVTITLNSPPVATCPSDTAFTLCGPEQICVGPFSASDPDGNLMSSSYTNGALIGNDVCFTPDTAGVYSVISTLTDSCGAQSSCTTLVTVAYTTSPLIADQSFNISLSDTATVCFVLPTVTGGSGPFTFTANGTPVTDSACVFLGTNTTVTLQIIVTDSCGKADTSSMTITGSVNAPPQIVVIDTTNASVCVTSDSVFVPFSVVDPDNGLNGLSGTSQLGIVSFVDSTIRFAVDTSGLYCDQLIVTDSFGLSDTALYCIAVTVNSAPTISCAPDTAVFLCASEQICVGPFSSGDIDGNVASVSYNFGTPSGSDICFTPDTAGVYALVCTITDSCGASASCTTLVTVAFNTAPQVTCANDTVVTLCAAAEICVTGFSATDADGNLLSSSVSFGTLLNGEVCFTPDTAGVYSIIGTATDSCNLSVSCTTLVTVNMSPAPVIADQIFNVALCDTATVCFPLPAVTNGAAPFSFTADGVAVNDSVCVFLDMNTSVSRQIIVTDNCGNVDTATITINSTVNTAPQVSIAASSTTFTCNVGDTVCTKFSVIDPDNGLSGVSSLGWVNMSDSTACFVVGDTAGVYCDQVTISDSCGLTDVVNYCVTVTLNTAPLVNCPSGKIVSICAPEEICVGPFSSSDVDNNIASVTYSFGTVSGANICFTPDTAGVYTISCIVVDSCGSADTCSADVTVNFNAAPSFASSTLLEDIGFTCSAGEVCLPIPALTGGSAPIAYTISGAGTLKADSVCFTLTTQTSNQFATLIATDSCGRADTIVIEHRATVNAAPEVTCPATFSQSVCDPSTAVICVPGVSVTDDGNLMNVTVNNGALNGSSVCFTPGAAGTYNIVVTATDSCGASVSCTTVVDVIQEDPLVCNGCPTITLEKAHNILQGERVCLSITTEGSARPFGGFDLLIAYDNSALVALGADPGSFIEGCGWEYFTYRFGANGNCSGACPSGVLRIIALAETNDGMNHPTCFGPSTTAPVELAQICFSVSNDRTLECQFAPVRFFWMDCGDNTLADQTGDTTFVSEFVYDFGNPNPINDASAGFPTYLGTQPECLVGGGPGKPAPIQCLTFINGGVDIICADSIDGRGDINLNGVDNEIADAVMFTEYFVSGLGSFSPHEAGSIAASEINGDGIPLTVADLVYLIRVIVGDALPLAKLAHNTESITFNSNASGTISADIELGAALFVFEGTADVTLLQSQMSMVVGERDGRTYALVIPNLNDLTVTAQTLHVGEIVTSSSVLLSASASDVDGALIGVSISSILPKSFTLNQNYPNPFNPSTKIDFTLPEAMAYNLSIYNVAGQKVQEFNGVAEGAVTVTWEAREVSSGLYFYKLTAGGNTSTRKMVFLK
ncbi:T9SS type A sorting domain-containing protein [bacterium AH-315-J21]|nr:T9SS type A sorting domain-containing protein [bacterium AH-315-J21]